MTINDPEIREALFKVFDGWAEQKAAMQAESAALRDQATATRDQATAHIKQMKAYEASFNSLTAQHESLRNLVQALDTKDEQT